MVSGQLGRSEEGRQIIGQQDETLLGSLSPGSLLASESSCPSEPKPLPVSIQHHHDGMAPSDQISRGFSQIGSSIKNLPAMKEKRV